MLIYHDPRPENIRSIILWTSWLLVIGYVVANAFYPNADVNIGVSVILGVMATMVLFFYLPAAIRAIVTGSADYQDFLIVGITLSWISQDALAWLSVIARLSGFSPAFMNSELFAPLKVLGILAAVCHVVPKGAANGVVPRSNTLTVGLFLAFAVGAAVVVVGVKPDVNTWIDRMPMWIRDSWRTGSMTYPDRVPSG